MFLLDTNIVSAIAKEPDGPAGRRFRREQRTELCTSVIVSAEILFGLANAGYPQGLTKRMRDVLAELEIIGIEQPADEVYASIRATMTKRGRSITPNDLIIAAHAIVLDATVVTADQGFRWVPDLRVENWLLHKSTD